MYVPPQSSITRRYIHMKIEKISLMSLLSSAGSYSLICSKISSWQNWILLAIFHDEIWLRKREKKKTFLVSILLQKIFPHLSLCAKKKEISASFQADDEIIKKISEAVFANFACIVAVISMYKKKLMLMIFGIFYTFVNKRIERCKRSNRKGEWKEFLMR